MDENRSAQLYLSEMAKYNLLAEEEEIELARRIAGGDERAKEELVTANLRLVVSIVRKEFFKHTDIEADLIQSGNIGLIKALKEFDPEQGRFSTYSRWWIMQEIFKELYKSKPKMLTREKTSKVISLLKVCRECFIVDMSTEESIAVIVREFNERYSKKGGGEYTEDDVRKIQEDLSISCSISLDNPLFDDGDSAMINSIADTNTKSPQRIVDEALTRLNVRGFVDRLKGEEERFVIIRLFGLDGEGADSWDEIAKKMGVKIIKVKQFEARARRRLKTIMKEARILGKV